MSFVCPECNRRGALEIVRKMEFPADCRSDEIALQIVECSQCGFLGAAVYEESRRGALDSESVDHRGYRASREDVEHLIAAIDQCPDPTNAKCQCSAHGFLGETKPQGQWRRWVGLRIKSEGTFPMALEPAQGRRTASGLTADEIRGMGFEWPWSPLVEEACTVVAGKVDLAKTLETLEARRSYYQGQVDQAYRFKQQTGADYADFTDRHDDNASMLRHQLRAAVAHVRQIIEAAGQ